jgi:hypothetical protein
MHRFVCLVSLTFACASADAAPDKQTEARGPVACAAKSSEWVRDCNTPRGREYYRVFLHSVGNKKVAALLPRPDGTPAIHKACGDKTLRPMLDKYGWCAKAVNPDRVNAMSTDDALVLAHALHESMKFVGSDGGVWPYPAAEDVALICVQGRAAVLASACRAYTPSDKDIAYWVDGDSARAMAAALNKLYGVP